MPTFTIYELPYLRRYQDRAASARQAAGLTTTTPLKTAHTAADSLTLRGIPAVGRSVAGHIGGTQPEQHTCR